MKNHRALRRDTRLWHPFADMGAVRRDELVIDRGEDVWVWGANGRRYLDATASLWYANVGHGRREIAAAVAAQLERLDAYSTFGDFANEPALRLAERLAELAPVREGRVFLASGGGDGIDTAAKLVRRYWGEVGQPERTHILGRTAGYHGTHGYGTAIGGIEANRTGWGPLVADVSSVQHDSVDAFASKLAELGPERVAAVFVEPVIGAGGVYPPATGYLERVAEICRETGVLLVIDAVICGFGRLGTWFGIERWGIEPDLIVFAKGVTSGYQPLGGVVVSGRVAEPFWAAPGAPVLRHGPTYAGHPACCAAALVNLEILEREGLLARGRELEGDLLAALAPLADDPLVCEVRGGVGLLGAVELDAAVLADDPGAVARAARSARERGVLVRPLGSSLAVSPPLTVTSGQLALISGAIAGALEDLAAATDTHTAKARR
jgi:adenosylmethionine-8-amino-7-oxononanoate aminotransferase